MDAETTARFRARLESLRAECAAALDTGGDAAAPVAPDNALGRLSRMDALQGQQMALALKERQRQTLARVENALRALDAGRYGACRRCGRPIPRERLEARPDSLFCVACAR
ncbi:MAG TPA: TraR/DksA C4-type zinc finger protein [Lacipirellulaceae bacterium]|nr:TraR/DksA C4-type zinc finger protein [Lacipirellulaceae bacterium]